VGCKMPTGITLDLDQSIWVNKDQPGMVPVTRVVKGKLAPVTLRGTAWRRGIDSPPITIDGYVFTQVPKVFWDEWIARNGLDTEHPFAPLVDGYIICAPTLDAAQKMSRERESDLGQNPPLVERDPRTRVLGVSKFAKEDA
jgi:hypothetical protein